MQKYCLFFTYANLTDNLSLYRQYAEPISEISHLARTPFHPERGTKCAIGQIGCLPHRPPNRTGISTQRLCRYGQNQHHGSHGESTEQTPTKNHSACPYGQSRQSAVRSRRLSCLHHSQTYLPAKAIGRRLFRAFVQHAERHFLYCGRGFDDIQPTGGNRFRHGVSAQRLDTVCVLRHQLLAHSHR